MVEYYISSTKCSIQERKTKKHGTVYDVVFRIVTMDGKEIQKKLSGFLTKKAAKEAHATFITDKCTLVKNNPIKKQSHITSESIPTVADLIPQYILSLNNQNKDSSIYGKIRLYNSIIIPMLGECKITDLTKERLYQWQDELWSSKNPQTGANYSYAYLEKIRRYFSAFLSWCDTRLGYPNHLKEVTKPKSRISKTEMQIWTREEFEKFIAVVDNPTYHAIFTMLFFTGRRRGEVLALQYEDVQENQIIFNKTYTRKTIDGSPYKITTSKNEKRGATPICQTLKDELTRYQGQMPFFFGGEKPIHENTISHAFESYIKKAGVKRIRMHDLRHSFVSMLIHLGANFMVVADLIGDTVEQVTQTYGHVYDSDKFRIIEMLN